MQVPRAALSTAWDTPIVEEEYSTAWRKTTDNIITDKRYTGQQVLA